jgi:predicted  nucleic acid-binding Zn-ribbon protein
VLDIMFMERRGGSRIPQQEWTNFLSEAVKQKWPFDKLARQIISADGAGDFRGAAKFLVQREVEPNALTRDIGRIFFGRDLQCAQCHDHPNITDYEQSEYFGIYAFVNRSYLFEDEADNKKSYVGEKGEGDVDFQSVFAPDEGSSRASPKLLNGLVLDIDSKLSADEAYIVAPSKTAAGVPKFSRRTQLARLITHPDNEHFPKNIANRLWAHMLGRGLVHPLDFHHSENPPSHPALLKMLADEFVASGFDYRHLLQQIALSDTYQRSIDLPVDVQTSVAEIDTRAAELKAALAAFASDDQQAQFQQQLEARRAKLTELDSAITAAMDRSSKLESNIKKSGEEVAALQKQLAVSQNQLKAVENAVVAARAVSQLSPQDQSLAEALSKYEQRVEPLKTDVTAKQTVIDEKSKQRDAFAKQLTQEKLQLGKLRGDRIGLADMVAEARGALGVFRAKEQQRFAQQNEIKRQLAALQMHRDYLDKLANADALAKAPAQLVANTELLAKDKAALAALIAQSEVSVGEDENAVAKYQQQWNTASAAIEQQKRTLEDLTSAVSKAETAAAELDDPQVQEAITVLKSKQQVLSDQVATLEQQGAELRKAFESAQSNLKPVLAKREQLIQRRTELESQIGKINTELDTAKQHWQAAVAASEHSLDQLRGSWEQRYVYRSLVPLTPEQLSGSTITALGLSQRFQREAENEWQTKNKDKKPEEIDEAQKRTAINALMQNRITAVLNTYVAMFAAPGGAPQDVFSATADQALFLANDNRVLNWLAPSAGTLLHRLHSVADSNEVAEELSLAILSRPATEQEKQEVSSYLESRTDDRNVALGELAWGLISSLEFRFNH